MLRHNDESRTTPILAYAATDGLVWCEPDILLGGGCVVNGIVVNEPVDFPTTASAMLFGSLLRGKTIVRQFDDVRDRNGKLIALVRTSGTSDLFPVPRVQLVKDMTMLQKAKFTADLTAAIAAKLK